MREVSPLGETLKYNLRHQPDLSKRPIKRVYYGMESLGYLITKKQKNAESLEAFKSRRIPQLL